MTLDSSVDVINKVIIIKKAKVYVHLLSTFKSKTRYASLVTHYNLGFNYLCRY